MKRKNLIIAATAAAFCLPLVAIAGGDKTSDGGAEAMFKSLDKNNDGSIEKSEAAGTPHEKNFARLDKNGDGKLSRAEHAAAPEHASAKASSSGSASSAPGGAATGSATTKGSKY